ncbi:MAG: NUDIX hydrolase [Candidatus Rokuibacteriota bacterium]
MEGASTVEPRPAASVILVREAAAGAAEPIEAYMIRRKPGMRFLGGYYAFPGGKVDPADATAASLACCHGLDAAAASACFAADNGAPALAYWVTAVRELLEETGVLLGCDAAGRPLDARVAETARAMDDCRRELMAGASFAALLARHGWCADTRGLAYLSHFITPRQSPIRFAARFFVCALPAGQQPRLFTEETSEGFWIHPGEGYRRFLAGEMPMAEPAEYALGYLAQFASLDDLRRASEDGTEKFHGIIHRIDAFWEHFDWKANRWPESTSGP